MTPIERAEAEELRKMEMKIEVMKIRLLDLKKKSEQIGHTENNESIEDKKEIVFKDDQEKIIKNTLGQMYVFLYLYKNILIKNVNDKIYFFFILQGKRYKRINYGS